MGTISEYFQRAAVQAGSYNKLAAALKTTCGNMTRIISGAGFPGDETVLRLAAYLGEDPKKLLLINQTERSPESARSQWAELLKRFAGAAVLIVCFLSGFSADLWASITPADSRGIYITGRKNGSPFRRFFLAIISVFRNMNNRFFHRQNPKMNPQIFGLSTGGRNRVPDLEIS